MPTTRDARPLVDGFSSLLGGVDSGRVPSLLQNNQLSFAVNCDLRGGFVKPRPGNKKVQLNFNSNTVVQTRFQTGMWQVGGYYKPDIGPEVLLCSIGGRQFRINVLQGNSVEEITISNRTTTTANFAPPIIGNNVVISVVSTVGLSPGAGILVNGKNYQVVNVLSATSVSIKNIDDDGSTNPVLAGSDVIYYDPNPSNIDQAWETQAEKWWVLRDGPSIPIIYDGATARRAYSNQPPNNGKEIGPGRMLTYGMGRIWGAQNDLRSFRAGDLVNGTSGTPANNFRDSVLKETENTFLNGGKDFVTPVNSGGISAMRFVATLDSSLGQGPLQVLTPTTTFSVNTPLDRTVWAALENPIQTISLINYGGLSHYGSILVNGDMIYRAIDGIRSLVLARREFTGWGNTPMSREMNRVIVKDNTDLLKYTNAVVFNNRLLMTASPQRTSHGVISKGWIILDFDLISSMGQKVPPVYDGLGIGLNILQIVKGSFAGVERCFAFTLNFNEEIELYEMTTSDKFDHQVDQTDIPISWFFETPAYGFGSASFPQRRILKRLNNLTLEIDNLVGTVNFKAYFRPDNYPCWILWKEWSDCATYKDCSLDPITGCQTVHNFKPQFRPRVDLGQPPDECDEITNRPLREGYQFQVRLEVQGYCEIRDLRLTAEERVERYYGTGVVGCDE